MTSPITSPALISPLPYSPSCEHAEDDEGETGRELIATLARIAETVHHDEGHGYRSVHAKSHGLLTGTLTVLPGLPPALAQGLFAREASYPLVMRLSTTPGDLLDDRVSTPRGLAIKIFGVPGERVEGSEDDTTQDFLMVNGPVFGSATARKFLGGLKLLAITTDKAPRLKQALSAALRGLETIIEKAGGESGTVKALGGHPLTHILGETFYSQVPVRHGMYMAKLSVAPVSPELLALNHAPLDTHEHPNAIRDAVTAHFARHGGEWELRAQLCVDIERMPIEDASVQWPEDLSPFVPVARLVAPRQSAWSAARAAAIDDGMSFSPWHALAAHQPIGSIMRVRKAVYAMGARLRAEHNAVSVAEPTSPDGVPD